MKTNQENNNIYKGSKSQLSSLTTYIISGIMFLSMILGGVFSVEFILMSLVLGIIVAYKYFSNKCTTYTVNTDEIILKHGILSTKTEVLELFKVKDLSLSQPILFRCFGLSNIYITSTDTSHPSFKIVGVPNGESLLKDIKSSVVSSRLNNNVNNTFIHN